MRIFIIIPVLNEERTIEHTLKALNITDDEELIVVDGGSSDSTVEIARRHTSLVIISPRGRGEQMRSGADAAIALSSGWVGCGGGVSSGGWVGCGGDKVCGDVSAASLSSACAGDDDVLLFLHADCVLPANAFSIIRDTFFRSSNVSAGAFDIKIDSQRKIFRLIEKAANLRSRITKTPYGDQGLFIKKRVYEDIGGFKNLPLMEDIEIARRIREKGRIAFISAYPILTSSRRWLKEGIVYTTVRDWILATLYTLFNVEPKRLVKYYKNVR
ncbi:glycosyl transferase family protein [Candidatus Magnetoovum chiemensis]|nr:glycosyl transferase family protein [Candidatus Magnetoovum chiemensis]